MPSFTITYRVVYHVRAVIDDVPDFTTADHLMEQTVPPSLPLAHPQITTLSNTLREVTDADA